MNKKQLSERDICTKFITPALEQFSPEFFDLIVIDECHRGSAAEDSAWREILRRPFRGTRFYKSGQMGWV